MLIQRAEIEKLHKLIRQTVPKLKPFIIAGMIGYGPFHYKYASGRDFEKFRSRESQKEL